MKKYLIAAAGMMLLAGSASAAEWQSLGRINNLTQLPNVDQCQQRVINHYLGQSTVFYPDVVHNYRSNNIVFVFNLDLTFLDALTRNDVPYLQSQFKVATDRYKTIAGPKSIHGSIRVGYAPNVAVDISYLDTTGNLRGAAYSIASREHQYYELQQQCPL